MEKITAEQVLKDALSIYPKAVVTDVTDRHGNAPNASNNYLMTEDGKSFAGIFSYALQVRWSNCAETTTKEGIPFKFYEKPDGEWARLYPITIFDLP
jgi:hypothetical protein